MSLWGSNCLCFVTAFWEHALHQKGNCSQNSGRFSSPGHYLSQISLLPSAPEWHFSPHHPSPEPFLQWHCCSTTTEKFQFPSQPHLFFETTKEVEELYKSTYSRRTKHLATELTPKETPNTLPIRILNYRRLKITIRRCSKSFLQYQMDLAINSQGQVTTVF